MTPNRSPWRSWTATTSSKTNTPSIERRSSTCSTLARGCDARWERLPGVMWRGLPRRNAGQPRGHPCLKGRCTAICTLVTCPFPTTSVCPDSWGRLDVRRRRRIVVIPGAELPHVPCPMVTARPVVHGVASRPGAIISHFTHPWAAGKNALSHGGMVRGTLLQQRASHVLSWFPCLDDSEGDRLEMPCLLTSGVSALQWMGVWMSRRQDS